VKELSTTNLASIQERFDLTVSSNILPDIFRKE